MRRSLAGWTLIEAMVALGLLAVVMGVVTHTLSSTARTTRDQLTRSLQQTHLETAVRHLEGLLGRTTVSGLRWLHQPGRGALLAAHELQDGPITTSQPRTREFWRLVLWDESEQTLIWAQSRSRAEYPPPSPERFESMPQAQAEAVLQELPATSLLGESRRLATRVTRFDYLLEPGPLARLELELLLPTTPSTSSGSGPARVRARRWFFLRNHESS